MAHIWYTNVTEQINRTPSNDDVKDMCGPSCKITEYPGLAEYNDLEDMLPKRKDYANVLYEEDENIGHWVGLLKYDNLYELFHPYGLTPNKELAWVNLKTHRVLNEQHHM